MLGSVLHNSYYIAVLKTVEKYLWRSSMVSKVAGHCNTHFISLYKLKQKHQQKQKIKLLKLSTHISSSKILKIPILLLYFMPDSDSYHRNTVRQKYNEYCNDRVICQQGPLQVYNSLLTKKIQRLVKKSWFKATVFICIKNAVQLLQS